MSDTANINLNQHVRVRLTEHGYNLLKKYFKDFKLDKIPESYLVNEKEFECKMPIWEFAQIFGSALYVGSQTIAVNNEITILD